MNETRHEDMNPWEGLIGILTEFDNLGDADKQFVCDDFMAFKSAMMRECAREENASARTEEKKNDTRLPPEARNVEEGASAVSSENPVFPDARRLVG